MISLRSWRSRITLGKIFFLFFFLAGCSVSGTAPDSPQAPTGSEVASPTRLRARNHAQWGKFEWAVQDYEAGDYKGAVSQFLKLDAGPQQQDFDLIPFYLGMSYFRLGNYKEAALRLEKFLITGKERQEGQDARITLVLAYEHLKDWNKVLGLAAESDKLTLFQNNQALLKLVWARALLESGELQGARAELKEASQFLDQGPVSDQNWNQGVNFESERDLWGRFYFTSLLIQERECNATEPKQVKSGKAIKTLYPLWLEAASDCYRASVRDASLELFRRDSSWSNSGEDIVTRGIDSFGKKIRAYLQKESKALNARRALEKSAREYLYRILNAVDENMKVFKEQQLSTQHLESIRKRIDLLLVSLANPS